jgi:hypothetical protein
MALGNALPGQASQRVHGEGGGRAARAVVADGMAIGLDDHGQHVATDAGGHRFHHAEDGIGRERRIDSAAAFAQHLQRGLGGKRVAGGDHAMGGAHAFAASDGGRDGKAGGSCGCHA